MSALSTELYSVDYDPNNPTMPWWVYGEGFGMRTFASKKDAIASATEFFGQAEITLRVWPDRTEFRVIAAPSADPLTVLNKAIAAIEAERGELENCPIHRAGVAASETETVSSAQKPT